ncbi:ferredoxin [Lamprobacter modestohalophilus]|uniref:ferredoxin n=1 Tax=Lamprobacter modestohalophilus TaxID=1064514 RepID=UPI002ADEB692|nr:ferredoxin [Lamprobacter modestohalophilus]MEA1051006.1 ferredoxin [Lamprobacter modestohalophilus]
MPQQRQHDMGTGGACFCPKCEYRAEHQRGVPCQDERCPHCGAKLIREGSHHDALLQQKRQG